MNETLVLIVGGAALAFASWRVYGMFKCSHSRWKRVLGIVLGGMIGVTVSIPLAAVMNPLVGLQPGTFHNLAFIALSLGFLGFCIGSLIGLIYAGMILNVEPRMEGESMGDSGDAAKPTEAREDARA